jgi:hypothetical protein
VTLNNKNIRAVELYWQKDLLKSRTRLEIVGSFLTRISSETVGNRRRINERSSMALAVSGSWKYFIWHCPFCL